MRAAAHAWLEPGPHPAAARSVEEEVLRVTMQPLRHRTAVLMQGTLTLTNYRWAGETGDVAVAAAR